ncbi:hypothetical protein MFKK_01890 [Halopseudomonas aestusnigri]|nr:hypothetical protein MFKK_01890 [Halopseudomonas aestusnigri]
MAGSGKLQATSYKRKPEGGWVGERVIRYCRYYPSELELAGRFGAGLTCSLRLAACRSANKKPAMANAVAGFLVGPPSVEQAEGDAVPEAAMGFAVLADANFAGQ